LLRSILKNWSNMLSENFAVILKGIFGHSRP
jgi:hypothetical protein